MSETILVTGAAGFIGSATCEKLLNDGHHVLGIDNMNDYYDVSLKERRLARVQSHPKASSFSFQKMDISDWENLNSYIQKNKPTVIINLAAQAGVRYSLENPRSYIKSNIDGFLNILEACRWLMENNTGFKHLVYASSSSVYGGNDKYPFEETDTVNDPRSLYAASKVSNELMANTYAHLFKIPCTGLRFFTVYGPWGRPDMAPIMFANRILNEEPIKVFNNGDLWRDFTYIDDIVEGVVRVCDHIPQGEKPTAIFNIGNNTPVKLIDFITTLEEVIGKDAIKEMLPWPPTEVYKTYANTDALNDAVGYKPATSLKEGLKRLVEWYKPYHDTQKKAS